MATHLSSPTLAFQSLPLNSTMVMSYCSWQRNDSMPAALRNETPYSELSPPAMMAILFFIFVFVINFACKITKKK